MLVAAPAIAGETVAVTVALIRQAPGHLLAGADSPVLVLKAPAAPPVAFRQSWMATTYRTRNMPAETSHHVLNLCPA
jgi:hypothetical protein